MTATNTIGRQVVVPLTNKSGGDVTPGDVVYLNDGSNADSFTTGTTSARTGGVGIAQQAIANNAVGLILVSGYAALVNVNASVTIGHYGQTYTVAKQATDAGTTRAAGTFCQFQTGGTTPDAIMWQPDLGGGTGMTNPMTNTGDVIYSSSGSTPARLGIGSAGAVLTSTGTAPSWSGPLAAPVIVNRVNGSNYTTNSTSYVDVDATNLIGTLALSATHYVRVSLACNVSVSVSSAGIAFAIHDGTSDNVFAGSIIGSTALVPFGASLLLPSQYSGSKTFKLRFKVLGSATATIQSTSGDGQYVHYQLEEMPY